MSKFQLPYIPDEREAVIEAYRRVFASPDGKIVLNHLCGHVCGISADAMTTDEKTTYKNIGRQRVALDVLSILNQEE